MSASSQFATLAGVALGGFVSFATAAVLERSRVKREEATRWMTSRLAAYTTYLGSVKRVYRLSREVFLAQADGMADTYVSEVVTEMGRHEEDRSVSFEAVVLLASQATIDAGVDLNSALARLESPARKRDPVSVEAWQSRSAEWLDALNRFQDAARRDLRVGDAFDHATLSRPAAFRGFVARTDGSRVAEKVAEQASTQAEKD